MHWVKIAQEDIRISSSSSTSLVILTWDCLVHISAYHFLFKLHVKLCEISIKLFNVKEISVHKLFIHQHFNQKYCIHSNYGTLCDDLILRGATIKISQCEILIKKCYGYFYGIPYLNNTMSEKFLI